ncbi:NAD(P)-binding protein [Deinococcus sp.]|uniref:NAD(P)/FAD-dependent oxidoreductase n=1 Tax=Deinococcus sp. TaxID=47478 RepID=UPI0025CDA29E|nr:NAD(P)-binding protein [Deinococcus sp.]
MTASEPSNNRSDQQTTQAQHTPQHADTLIVGAGLAGLALARELAAHEQSGAGQGVLLLDKSRGVSGRSSTRRSIHRSGTHWSNEALLDHGARFFTARAGRTRTWVQGALEEGWLAEWTRSVPVWEAGQVSGEPGRGHPRYVPPGGMNVIGRELGRDLSVLTQTQAVSVRRQGDVWQVGAQDGRVFTARRLVLNLPPPQIVPLLEGAGLAESEVAESEEAGAGSRLDLEALRAVQFDPCWAVGAVLNADLSGAEWPALRLNNHPSLDWLAREHTKRPPGQTPTLMLHARADWSRGHLQDTPAEVTAALLEAAREVAGPFTVESSFAHRWLYATPTVRYEHSFGWHSELALGWCGDWCVPDPHGPRVEAALLSGWELADRLLEG